MAQRIDQQGDGRRGLATARVVEVVARPRRAPFLKRANETSAGEMGLSEILGHIGKPKTGERGVQNLKDAVEHELTFYPHLEIVAILLKVETVAKSLSRRRLGEVAPRSVSSITATNDIRPYTCHRRGSLLDGSAAGSEAHCHSTP